MLRAFLAEQTEQFQPEYLVTYTRNPSVLKMIASITDSVYPFEQEESLRNVALAMEGAELGDDGVTYHVDRYPEGGLYGTKDPAETIFDGSKKALRDRFQGLVNPRSALIAVAQLRKEE